MSKTSLVLTSGERKLIKILLALNQNRPDDSQHVCRVIHAEKGTTIRVCNPGRVS